MSFSVTKHKQTIMELKQLSTNNETWRKFNALLSEMQNADHLVENHSGVSLLISTGLLALATTTDMIAVPVWALATLVFFVIVIWSLKIYRHKQIFDHCQTELLALKKYAVRLKPSRWYLHGFTLMYALVAVISLAWIGVVLFQFNT